MSAASPRANHGIRLLALSSPDALAREIARVGCAAEGVRAMAPKGCCHVLRLEDVPAAEANTLKIEMLAAGGDAAIHAGALAGTLARTAVVLLGTEAQYQLCGKKLAHYPGGLPAIARAIAETLRHLAGRPRLLRCGRHTLPLGARTYVMGILNMTPDSFSGEGLGGDVERALRQADAMLADGAHLLDIGGESTRPGAEAVPVEEELRRVVPAIRAIAERFAVPISVDTTKSAVARAAVEAGATLLNDISGLHDDPEMAAVAAAAGVPVVVMHMQGTPRTMQHHPVYLDLMTEVWGYLCASTQIAIAAGVPRDQVVLDPGFGFGKSPEHNLTLLRRLRELTSTGQPVLVGTSRKSTIGKVLGNLPPEDRLEGTAATVALSIANGADLVRVHDVKHMARVAKMADAIARGGDE